MGDNILLEPIAPSSVLFKSHSNCCAVTAKVDEHQLDRLLLAATELMDCFAIAADRDRKSVV